MLRKVWKRLLVFGLIVSVGMVSIHIVLAHGSMSDPISRVYSCYLEGPESPDTVVCSDVIAAGGTQQLYDWNEINISNAAGNHQAIIPDGELCSAGREKYAAFNEPRTDWPRTILPDSGTYTFLFDAFVPHNQGYFELWVTKDGYDPTQPLAWDDIELFALVDEPPVVDGAYYMPVELPEGKSGHHVIYAIWQRNDSQEAFYSCSDVWFGNSPTPTPTTPPACTAPTWNSGTTYSEGDVVSYNNSEWMARWNTAGSPPSSAGTTSSAWRIQAYCTSGGPVPTATTIPPTATTPPDVTPTTVPPTATGVPPTATSVPPTATTPPTGGPCTVDYEIVNPWETAFQANVTITNNDSSPVSGWTLTWTHAAGQTVDSAWNATVGQTGNDVTASNPASHWNGTIGANGGSVSFGLIASRNGTIAIPTDFVLNGTVCNGDIPPTVTPSPTMTPSVTATTCPLGTPVPMIVDPVTSPTDALSQTLVVRLGNGEWVRATGPAGTVTVTEPDPDGFYRVTIPLVANATNEILVEGQVGLVGTPGEGCVYGGYILSRNVTIVQQGGTPTPTATATATATATQTPTATPGTGSSCSVDYVVQDDWGSGFVANVTIGVDTAVSGWTLDFDFPGNQTITNAWGGAYSQSGSAVTVSNESWNGNIPAGGTVSFGFQATYSGSNAVSSTFTLNGEICTQ